MRFRNYCIVVMGNMEGVKDDIIKVADSKPRYIDAKGILIATFASVATSSELNDFFNFNERSFFLFDLNEESSAYHMDNIKLHNHLFGHLIKEGDKLNKLSEKLMNDISATTEENKSLYENSIENKINEAMFNREYGESRPVNKPNQNPKLHINDMSKKEREVIINRILDKGYKKLTEDDKDILKKISEIK